MNKKQILYIEGNKDGTVGGSYYSLYNLVKGIDKDKYEPYVLFCDHNTLISEFKKVTDHIIIWDYNPSGSAPCQNIKDFLKWPVRFIREVIFQQPKIIKKIKEIKPDLVHLNNGYASNHDWMLACQLTGVKIIAHDRGTRYPCSARTKLFVRFLDAIISVSEAYKSYVIRQKLKVPIVKRVYNGIDPDKFTKLAEKIKGHRISSNFSLNDDDVLIGMIGNIQYWKGQIVFVRAFHKAKKKFKNIKGIIVGKTTKGAKKYEEEIKEYIMENGLSDSLILTGYRKDIPEILRTIDIFAHASVDHEPFARTILEAMAFAKPIIASNGGGCPEQIIDGETGLLFPMGNETAMAEAIIYYLSDMNRAREIGQRAKERLLNLFSVDSMVKGVEEVYEEVFGTAG